MFKILARIPIQAWIILATVVLIAGGVTFLSLTGGGQPAEPGALKEAPLLPGVEEFEIQGATHINPGSSHPPYNSNPPTSGWHWSNPASCQFYDTQQLADEQIIHNLEHGVVWVSYKPDIGEENIAKLKEIVEKNKNKVIATPRAQNDSAIALASWGRLLKLDQVDEQRIVEFIKTYRNRGPELVPC